VPFSLLVVIIMVSFVLRDVTTDHPCQDLLVVLLLKLIAT